MGYDFTLERETKAAMLIREAIVAAGQAGDEELLLDCIEGETGLIEQIDQLLSRGAELAAMSLALDHQSKELTARKQRFKENEETIRRLLLSVLNAVGLAKMERPLATLSVRAGSVRVAIENEGALPEEFFNVTRTPSLSAIKKAIDAGQDVPGAGLAQGAPSLMLKRT